jgi:hypothetical protein
LGLFVPNRSKPFATVLALISENLEHAPV